MTEFFRYSGLITELSYLFSSSILYCISKSMLAFLTFPDSMSLIVFAMFSFIDIN